MTVYIVIKNSIVEAYTTEEAAKKAAAYLDWCAEMEGGRSGAVVKAVEVKEGK